MITARVNRWSAVIAGLALLSGSAAPTSAGATSEPPELEGTIVFGRYGGEYGNETYFVANADGTNERLLVDHESCCPWAARDGSRVAVAAHTADGRTTTEIVNVDGSGSTVLAPPSETLSLSPGPFTPDGSQIAYNVGEDEVNDPSLLGIYLGSSSDTSDAVRIITGNELSVPHQGTIAMDFNPDGSELLLYVQAQGDDSDTHGFLALASVDGSDIRRLTPDGVDVPCCARWSPDGKQIVFAELDGRLLLIDPETAEMTEVLVPDGTWARNPNWSPDGSQIMFTLDTSPAPQSPVPNEIFVVNADGTGLTAVIVSPDHKDSIWWVPTAAGSSN